MMRKNMTRSKLSKKTKASKVAASVKFRKNIKPVLNSSESEEDIINNWDERVEMEELKQELERWEKKYQRLKQKYVQLEEKCEKLSALNLRFQENFLNSVMNVPSRTNTESQEKKRKTVSLDLVPKPRQIPNDAVIKEYIRVPVVECGPDILDHEVIAVMPDSMRMQDVVMQEEVCSISEKLSSDASMKVKPGEAGDSVFAKNLATVIFGSALLMNSSVTGSKCRAKKESTPKPPLDRKKMELLTELFIKRIKEHNCNVSEEEIARRVKKIRYYISEKIATLNRYQKNDNDIVSEKK